MKTKALLSLAFLFAAGTTARYVHAQDPHGHSAHHAETEMPFPAKHVEKSATITLHGDIDTVWPLFDPINESKWVSVWKPEILYPASRAVQEGMVFRTHGTVWVVTRYDTERRRITYTVSHPEKVHTIDVQCTKHGASLTDATVTYSYTGLSEAGNELVVEDANKMFANDLEDWQKLINHYLETGEPLAMDRLHDHGHTKGHH